MEISMVNKKSEEKESSLYKHWGGKGQIYFTSDAYLGWKPMPWTTTAQQGSKEGLSVRK